MSEIKLPIKYALVPVKSNEKTIAYIIVKCYFLEGKITYSIDGSIDAKCRVVECKNAKEAFVDGTINDEFVHEVSCVFNDIDLAKDEQRKVNELIIEQLLKSNQISDFENFKVKQEATVRSLEKMRSITDKKYSITTTAEKKLIYSKE